MNASIDPSTQLRGARSNDFHDLRRFVQCRIQLRRGQFGETSVRGRLGERDRAGALASYRGRNTRELGATRPPSGEEIAQRGNFVHLAILFKKQATFRCRNVDPFFSISDVDGRCHRISF